jgi:hypothetical protein
LNASRPADPPNPSTRRQRFEYDLAGQPTVHPRRTLDQFYYPSLTDTNARDADQTVSKWSGSMDAQRNLDRAADDSLIIMADQLWIWMIDESELRFMNNLIGNTTQ